MPRIIAQSRIPRVSIGNRQIAVPPTLVDPRGVPVGSMLLSAAAPSITGQTYEDAAVASGMIRKGDYPLLYDAAGPISGLPLVSNPSPPNNAHAACAVWNGAVYMGMTGVGAVKKRAAPLSPDPGGNVWATTMFVQGLSVANGLLVVGGPSGANGFLQVATDDATRTAEVNIGANDTANPNRLRAAFGATGAILAIMQVNGPLFRSINNGVAWTQPSAAILSNPAQRVWMAIWRGIPPAIHMVGQAGAIATSVDEGATWTINTAVPGATFNFNNMSNGAIGTFHTSVVVDPVTRKGYGLADDQKLYSFNLDNPTVAGFTVLTAAVYGANTAVCIYTPYGLMTHSQAVTRTGLWVAPWSNPTAMVQVLTLAQFPNQAQYCPIGGMAILPPIPDGRLYFEAGPWGSGLYLDWGIPDLADGFYRYLAATTPTPLTSGAKPYIRIR